MQPKNMVQPCGLRVQSLGTNCVQLPLSSTPITTTLALLWVNPRFIHTLPQLFLQSMHRLFMPVIFVFCTLSTAPTTITTKRRIYL